MKKSLILFIASIVVFSGCKKKEEAGVLPGPLFTITFAGDYIIPGKNAIVFLSDRSGNLLADTICSGNKTYELTQRPGLSRPDTFSVTIVNTEKFSAFIPQEEEFVRTYTGVTHGEWEMMGKPKTELGFVSVSFQPEPAGFQGMRIMSISDIAIGSGSFHPIELPMLYSPDSVYIKCNVENQGPMYKWCGTVRPGDTVQYGFDGMKASNLSGIYIQPPHQQVTSSLFGILDSSGYYPRVICLDVSMEMSSTDSLSLGHPGSFFKDYVTTMTVSESYPGGNSYYYFKYGSIPEQFKRPGGNITSESYSGNVLSLALSGTVDVETGSMYFRYDQGKPSVNWAIYLPGKSQNTFILPEVPASFISRYPGFVTDSVKFSGSYVTEYYSLENYYQYLYTVFNPVKPVSEVTLEYSKGWTNISMPPALFSRKEPKIVFPGMEDYFHRASMIR